MFEIYKIEITTPSLWDKRLMHYRYYKMHVEDSVSGHEVNMSFGQPNYLLIWSSLCDMGVIVMVFGGHVGYLCHYIQVHFLRNKSFTSIIMQNCIDNQIHFNFTCRDNSHSLVMAIVKKVSWTADCTSLNASRFSHQKAEYMHHSAILFSIYIGTRTES